MFRSLLSVLVLGVLAFAQPNKEQPTAPPWPQKGSDIPGAFHAYNINGKKKGNYHCLISEFGLNPVVMVAVRGVEDRDGGLRQLLIKLDNLVDKNPITRLAAFAIFTSSTLKDVAREDDQRDDLVKKIESLFKEGAGLKHLVLALDTPKKLEKWNLDPKADVTVILYKEFRTYAVHNITWDELKPAKPDELPAKVKEILDDVRDRFGAKR